ncbi:MAG: NADH-quinone oxidoreductase subunit J [Acidimicrobiales bacterium]
MEAAVFFISAAIILAGGLGVILLGNPVHAALSLVMTLFGVAVLFINLEAYFVAVVQVIVYAGAIVVLFLFVIMLVGVDRVEDVRAEPLIGQREFALLIGAGLVAVAIVIGVAAGAEVTGRGDPGLEIAASEDIESDGDADGDNSNISQIGRVLFTDYVFAFEITALLLTISVVGAVVLSRRPKAALQPIPESDPPWPMRVDPNPDLEVVTDVDEQDLEAAEAAAESDAAAEPDEDVLISDTHDEEAPK